MTVFEPTERSRMIGRRLKKLRRLNGMTLEEAVAQSDLPFTDSTLSRLELGRRLPRDGELFSLAKAYGVTLQHITRSDSPVDDPTYKLGDKYHGKSGHGIEQHEPPAPTVLPVTPNTIAAATAARRAGHPSAGVLTSIPAGLPPQRSSSAVMTPSEYVEKVYVPNLERQVADLTAKLERANQMLKANGYQQVLL